MRSEKRHLLKQNDARSVVSRVLSAVAPHFPKIVVGLAIIVVAFVSIVVMKAMQSKKNVTAGKEIQKILIEKEYSDIRTIPVDAITMLEELAKKHKSTISGSILATKVAQRYYSDVQYDKALEMYTVAMVSAESKDAVHIARAYVYIDKKDYTAAENELKNISKKSYLADNALYLNYICAKMGNNTSKLALLEIEIEKEDFKKTPFYGLLKARSVTL